MENSDQWMDDYLLERLDAEAMENFSRRLKKDPELRKEIENRKVILGMLDAFGDLEMMEQISAVHQKEMTQSRKTRRLPILWSTAAAIALAIGLCIWLWPKTNTPAQLFAANYEAYELSFAARSKENSAQLAKANQFYQAGDFAAALPLLQKIADAQEASPKIDLAIAIAQIETGQYQTALSYFNAIKNKDFDLYRDHAFWYAALLQLKQGNIDAAKKDLQQLTKQSKNPFYRQAKSLLSQL